MPESTTGSRTADPRACAGSVAGGLAAWATAWLTDRCSFDAVLDAVTDERAHLVSGFPGTGALGLGPALVALRGLGERRLRLVLPVPGDVRGLPRVPGLAELALTAGEATLGDRIALVPVRAGAEVVEWTAVGLPSALLTPAPVEGTLRAAAGALDLAIGDTARTLADLDLARWHPEVPALLAGLAGPPAAPVLPPDADPVAVALLARAQRLALVVRLATADSPGGSVTGAQAAARDAALRPLATAVREALTAAYNAVPR